MDARGIQNHQMKAVPDMLLVILPPQKTENPSMGLGYLDSYIRSKGLKTEVLDLNIYFYNTAAIDYRMLWRVENKNYWKEKESFSFICQLFENEINQAVKKILSYPADLIGFLVADPNEWITVEVIKRIKTSAGGKIIILAGPACQTKAQRFFFETNLPGSVDCFVVGEGEQSFCEIIEQKQNKPLNGNLTKLTGRESLRRALINPLDAISFPDYRGFDLSQYFSKKSIAVEWSWGCLGQCSFCKNHLLTSGYRRKTPEAIFNELNFFKKNYGIDTFMVSDNLINGDVSGLKEVCNKIIKGNLGVKWSGQIVPGIQMRNSLFRLMRQAGCFKVWIEIDSGSPKVLKLMKKPYSLQLAVRNIRAAKAAGLETEIFLIVGFPGETEKEFCKTLNFLKRNYHYIDSIKSANILQLLEGTQVYDHPSSFGLECLPKNGQHYLWQTKDGNTYSVRKERARRLFDLAISYGIKVQEGSVKEKNELFLKDNFDIDDEKLTGDFKTSLLSAQGTPALGKVFRKTKKISQWALLSLSVGFIFFYIVYFWLFMVLKNKLILGGRKKQLIE